MTRRLLAALVLWIAAAAGAQAAEDLATILARASPPAGVVFELFKLDVEEVRSLIPQVADHVETLRARFPGLPVAVVSHGNELRALQRKRAGDFAQIHDQVQRLTGTADVEMHACGTYAGWQGIAAEDFPDYIDVVPSGPQQIRDYEERGYVKARL